MMAAASALCRQQAAAEGDGQPDWPAGRCARWRSRAALAVAPAHSSAAETSLSAGGLLGGGGVAGVGGRGRLLWAGARWGGGRRGRGAGGGGLLFGCGVVVWCA